MQVKLKREEVEGGSLLRKEEIMKNTDSNLDPIIKSKAILSKKQGPVFISISGSLNPNYNHLKENPQATNLPQIASSSSNNVNVSNINPFGNRPYSEDTQSIVASAKMDYLQKNSSRKGSFQNQLGMQSAPHPKLRFQTKGNGGLESLKRNEKVEEVEKFKKSIKNSNERLQQQSQQQQQQQQSKEEQMIKIQSALQIEQQQEQNINLAQNNQLVPSHSILSSNQLPLTQISHTSLVSPSIGLLVKQNRQQLPDIKNRFKRYPEENKPSSILLPSQQISASNRYQSSTCPSSLLKNEMQLTVNDYSKDQNISYNKNQEGSLLPEAAQFLPSKEDPTILKSQKQSEITQNEEVDLTKSENSQKILKWKQGDFIGSGSFGQVFTAMNCNTGEIFVVKKVMAYGQMPDKGFLDEQEKELKIMQTLSHNHIIQSKGHERHQDCLYIFLEYMSEGNIDQMLKKFGPMEEQTIKVYARQILSAIEYLHSKKVIHKDIKGANILVGSDGVVKLSDFGCAKQLELTLNSSREMNKTLKGSVPWMSPEIVTQTKYDTKADIWSFGCTLLEMASAKAPWSNYEFDNPIAAIMKIGLSNEIPEIPTNISIGLDTFIRKCLERDPQNRLTASQLISDSFLQETP